MKIYLINLLVINVL